MVITKELNQKVIIAAIIISLFLIIGSIYLHMQQKTHLGRMNIGDGRVKPTLGVENLPNNDAIFEPPLQQTVSESSITQPEAINFPLDENNVEANDSNEYVNDSSRITGAAEDNDDDDASVASSKGALGDNKSTESYIMDNDYGPSSSIEYEYPTSDEYAQANANDELGLSKDCLRCLCKTINDCKPVKCALVDPCGIYGISKNYWTDAGKPVTKDNLNDYSEEDEEYRDYLRCINNEKCATETVQKYIKRYQRDCNNDGIINCQDQIALHLLGPSGCSSKQMSPIHRMRMNLCLK